MSRNRPTSLGINEVNDALSPVTEVNPDALDIASMLDDERSRGVVRGYVRQRRNVAHLLNVSAALVPFMAFPS